MKLTRLFDTPLLSSRIQPKEPNNPRLDMRNVEHWWELRGVFNPGAVLKDGIFNLLYRAQDFHFISRFGLALFDPTTKKIIERPDLPVFELTTPEELRYGRIGCEDPRIVYFKDEDIYMVTFVSATIKPVTSVNLDLVKKSRIYGWYDVFTRNLSTVDFTSFADEGFLLRAHKAKDIAIFPQRIGGHYGLLLRFPPSIQLAFSEDLEDMESYVDIILPRDGMWDNQKVGVGPPPIWTEKGWLCIYHGVDKENVYRLGYVILDLHDPSKVLYRTKDPILEPKLRWEKHGNTPNVVFCNGAGVYGEDVYVFYGAADSVIGVSKAPLNEFLKEF